MTAPQKAKTLVAEGLRTHAHPVHGQGGEEVVSDVVRVTLKGYLSMRRHLEVAESVLQKGGQLGCGEHGRRTAPDIDGVDRTVAEVMGAKLHLAAEGIDIMLTTLQARG